MEKAVAEEKAATPPSSMREAIEGAKGIIAQRTASPSPDGPEIKAVRTGEATEEPCVGCEEEKKAQEAAATEKPKGRLFIVDEETGEKIPAVFNSEGKEYIPETLDKLKTWTGLGIHANKRLEEVKENETLVKTILQAWKEGRIAIRDKDNGQPSGEKETVEKTEEDDEIITDPAVFKERQKTKALESRLAEAEKAVNSLKVLFIRGKANEVETEIRREMDALAKEFPLGKKREKEVWKLLAEVNEEGKPVHNTKSAMKMVHEAAVKDLREWVQEHPEFIEKDKIVKEGVTAYLREKEQKEVAPVASPSGLPAGRVEPEPKEEIKGMADAVDKLKKFISSKKEAGKAL